MDYITHYNTHQERNRFHHKHGNNIILSEDNTIAYRTRSFYGAGIYSHHPLAPGELFLVEIEETERGWSGHMRIGLTRRDPNTDSSLDLQFGESNSLTLPTDWVVGISKAQIIAAKKRRRAELKRRREFIPPNYNNFKESSDQSIGNKRLSYDSQSIRTCRGIIPRYCLKSSRARGVELYPSDVGSRIGVMFIPTSENKADMHVIINGEDEGPLSTDIPYRDAPLFVTIDLYGTTKKIRIIQMSFVPSLQASCRESILRRVPENMVHSLPLPKLLKNYLLFEV